MNERPRKHRPGKRERARKREAVAREAKMHALGIDTSRDPNLGLFLAGMGTGTRKRDRNGASPVKRSILKNAAPVVEARDREALKDAKATAKRTGKAKDIRRVKRLAARMANPGSVQGATLYERKRVRLPRRYSTV